jgi:hypothetical protein
MGCHRNYLFDHKIHYQYMFCCVSCSYPIIIISFSLQDTHLICLNYLYSNISVSKMFYFVIKFYMNKLIIVIVILYFTNVILYNCFPCIKEIWRFVHPRKVGNMTISRVNKFSYLPYVREMNVLFHQANVLVNSAKWNLLAIFVYQIIISEHLWSYLY